MARKGNNYGVLLKKIAAMFTFSLSALTHIGRQDGEWELLLKYDHDDVHNFKTCRAEYICGGGVTSDSKRVMARFSKPDFERLNFNGLGTCLWGRKRCDFIVLLPTIVT